MPNRSINHFSEYLGKAIRRIAAHRDQTIGAIQDELGYALGRNTGGSAIDYWRRGHIPSNAEELEKLVELLTLWGGLSEQDARQLLESARHPAIHSVMNRLFPENHFHAAPRQHSFVAGPPITRPEQFYGRVHELERIFRLWSRRPFQHIAITGPRRSGKTSLLYQLQNTLRLPPAQLRHEHQRRWLPEDSDFACVFIDFQDVRMCEQERLLIRLLEGMGLPAPRPCTLSAFMDAASRGLPRPTLLFFDEIAAALSAPQLDLVFWGSLRSLVTNQTGGVLGVVVSSENPPQLTARDFGKPSPFFNIFSPVLRLGPLTPAESGALLHHFSPEDQQWITETSENWPFLLQILGRTLQDSRPGEDWRAEGLAQIEPYRYLLERHET